MTKTDALFIRACKSKEPYIRVLSVYKRFYYRRDDKSHQHIALILSGQNLRRSKMFKTTEVDYTNCHPDIAKALKENKTILCEVWDGDSSRRITEEVIAFDSSSSIHPYIADVPWQNAEPKPVSMRVKPLKRIIRILLDDGYTPELSCGNLRFYHSSKPIFNFIMMSLCGKVPSKTYIWEPEWLEEVDE